MDPLCGSRGQLSSLCKLPSASSDKTCYVLHSTISRKTVFASLRFCVYLGVKFCVASVLYAVCSVLPAACALVHMSGRFFSVSQKLCLCLRVSASLFVCLSNYMCGDVCLCVGGVGHSCMHSFDSFDSCRRWCTAQLGSMLVSDGLILNHDFLYTFLMSSNVK